MKLSIDLSYDQIDSIVQEELTKVLKDSKEHLKSAKKGKVMGCYSWNKEEEMEALKKEIKALKLILGLYEV